MKFAVTVVFLDTCVNNATSRNIKELGQFLGLTGCYRYHINRYADITHTLTHLLRKDDQYHWTEPHQRAFTAQRMFTKTTSPSLSRPYQTQLYFVSTHQTLIAWITLNPSYSFQANFRHHVQLRSSCKRRFCHPYVSQNT